MVAARRNAPITTTFGLLNALGYPAGTDEVSSDVEVRLRSARKCLDSGTSAAEHGPLASSKH